MDISAISGVGAAKSGTDILTQAIGQAGGKLGKNEFLEMLTVQMQNQDPLDPVKNEDMIAQLAQFSSLEQMQNLNQAFSGFRTENAMLTASQWGGQTLRFELNDGTSVEGVVDGVWSLDGATYVQVGGSSVAVADIAGISWPAAGGAEAEAATAAETAATGGSGGTELPVP